MAVFKLIEKPDIVVAYIAIKESFKNGEDKNPQKRLSLLNKLKLHIDKEIKIANAEAEHEQSKKYKQITVEEVIEEESKMQNTILPKEESG